MSPAEYTKLVESVRQFGFIDPLIVREKPNKRRSTKYETINGAHRWQAAEFLGMDVIRCINLGKVSDTEAAELAIILNDLKGKSDQVRLAERLRKISDTVPFAKLASVMPYGSNELKMYIQSVDFSFASLSGDDARPAGTRKEDRAKEETKLTFTLPAERSDRVLALLEKIGPTAAEALEKVTLEYAQRSKITWEPSKNVEAKPARKRTKKKAGAA